MVNLFFVLLCFLVLIPVLYAFSVSLNADNSLLSSDFSFLPKHMTLANYRAVFVEEPILRWFSNSIWMAAAAVFISLGTGIPAAYVFSRKKFPGRKVILRLLILLYAFPALLSMTALYKLLSPMGLINSRLGLLVVYTGTMSVFALWNMKGYFDTIPLEIEEAAMIDGAKPVQLVTKIVLPLARPTIVVTGMMVLIYVWNEYIFAINFMTERGNLYAGGRALFSAGYGDERQLAGVCGGLHSGFRPYPDHILRIAEKHDNRPDFRRSKKAERIRYEQKAVLHIPMSQYAFALDEERMVFRLRTARGDMDACRLYYGDRSCRQTPVIFDSVLMKVAAQDELFDYYETEFVSPYRRLCYYFELTAGEERFFVLWGFFSPIIVWMTARNITSFPYMHRDDLVRPPQWMQDAVVYNIFPDSFASGKGFISNEESRKEFHGKTVRGKRGGTLRGITENIGYLKELGFNTLYMNPIFAAGEYHKYDLIDYFHVDPCFGRDEDFRELVDTCHGNGMRVIIDGVFNHCGWQWDKFGDVVDKGKDSQYSDWFYRLEYRCAGRRIRRSIRIMSVLGMNA